MNGKITAFVLQADDTPFASTFLSAPNQRQSSSLEPQPQRREPTSPVKTEGKFFILLARL